MMSHLPHAQEAAAVVHLLQHPQAVNRCSAGAADGARQSACTPRSKASNLFVLYIGPRIPKARIPNGMFTPHRRDLVKTLGLAARLASTYECKICVLGAMEHLRDWLSRSHGSMAIST